MLTETVCVVLSGAGLAVALLTAWRRRFRRAARIAAVALLPVGLVMTGLITLGRKIGEAMGSWGAGLVLQPTVWAGFGVLGLAVVLYAGTRSSAGRGGRKVVTGEEKGHAVAPGSSAAALGTGTTVAGKRSKGKQGGDAADDGLSGLGDIEEILRKHGI